MGRFTRDAPWLRKLFPASGAPATKQPSAVSEDVQLTNLYLAGGQVQDPPAWIFTQTVPNPGNNAVATILAPISFALQGPEVWRVFFMSIRAITPGPTTDFGFDIRLNFPATGLSVMLVTGLGIFAGIIASTTVPLGSPLVLPTDETSNVIAPSASVNVQLFQTSGDAAATFNLVAEYYILRNPKGVAHYL